MLYLLVLIGFYIDLLLKNNIGIELRSGSSS